MQAKAAALEAQFAAAQAAERAAQENSRQLDDERRLAREQHEAEVAKMKADLAAAQQAGRAAERSTLLLDEERRLAQAEVRFDAGHAVPFIPCMCSATLISNTDYLLLCFPRVSEYAAMSQAYNH